MNVVQDLNTLQVLDNLRPEILRPHLDIIMVEMRQSVQAELGLQSSKLKVDS
jgi:hypothetical protein